MGYGMMVYGEREADLARSHQQQRRRERESFNCYERLVANVSAIIKQFSNSEAGAWQQKAKERTNDKPVTVCRL